MVCWRLRSRTASQRLKRWLPLRPLLSRGDFPGGTSDKESACQWRDAGLIPGLGRSPGGRNGSPLQYSCLENPTDRGASVHRVAKNGHNWSDLVAGNISVQFSRSVVSDSLRPHESQPARPPCPSPTPRVYPNSALVISLISLSSLSSYKTTVIVSIFLSHRIFFYGLNINCERQLCSPLYHRCCT